MGGFGVIILDINIDYLIILRYNLSIKVIKEVLKYMSEKSIRNYIKEVKKDIKVVLKELKETDDREKLAFALGQYSTLYYYDREGYYDDFIVDIVVACMNKLDIHAVSSDFDLKLEMAGYVLFDEKEAQLYIPLIDHVIEGIYHSLDSMYEKRAKSRAAAVCGIARRFELSQKRTWDDSIESLWDL